MTDNRPMAFIMDRDGTMASVAHVRPDDRTPAAWANFNAALPFDAPVPAVVDLARVLTQPGSSPQQVRALMPWLQDRLVMPDGAAAFSLADLDVVTVPLVGILVSGRAEGDWPGDRRRRFQMQDWAHKHDIPFQHLFMRTGGDVRRDSVVKQEILDTLILPRFRPVLAIDDRDQVIDMWLANNIPVIRVSDPAIPPPILGRVS